MNACCIYSTVHNYTLQSLVLTNPPRNSLRATVSEREKREARNLQLHFSCPPPLSYHTLALTQPHSPLPNSPESERARESTNEHEGAAKRERCGSSGPASSSAQATACSQQVTTQVNKTDLIQTKSNAAIGRRSMSPPDAHCKREFCRAEECADIDK